MSLGLASFIARGSLAAISQQTSTVSRNIAVSGLEDASRKLNDITHDAGMGVRAEPARRVEQSVLREQVLEMRARASAERIYAEGLDRIDPASQSVDDPDGLTARFSAFVADLAAYTSSPDTMPLAAAAAGSAQALARAIAGKASNIAELQSNASRQMLESAGRINDLLAQYARDDAKVVDGQARGLDTSDARDSRDRIATELSGEIGLRMLPQANGSVSLFTDGGATLFDRTVRPVSVGGDPLAPHVIIDNSVVTGADSLARSTEGRIAGLVRLRDEAAPAYLRHLDAIASALIAAAAETDPTGSLPLRPGLFTWGGAPAMPPAGASGVAAGLALSPLLNPDTGTGLARLRDGGLSSPADPAYGWPSTGAAYGARLRALADSFGATQAFADGSSQTIAARASDATSWLAQQRQSAAALESQAQASLTAASSALGQATGISLDDELARMLELENAYAASARLMTTLDAMFDALITAAR